MNFGGAYFSADTAGCWAYSSCIWFCQLIWKYASYEEQEEDDHQNDEDFSIENLSYSGAVGLFFIAEYFHYFLKMFA